MSSAELLYGAPLVLPGQLPGVPESPLAVFHESTRAALSPSLPGVLAPPRSLQRSLISSKGPPLSMFAAAVPIRHSHPLTAGHSQWYTPLPSSSYWI